MCLPFDQVNKRQLDQIKKRQVVWNFQPQLLGFRVWDITWMLRPYLMGVFIHTKTWFETKLGHKMCSYIILSRQSLQQFQIGTNTKSWVKIESRWPPKQHSTLLRAKIVKLRMDTNEELSSLYRPKTTTG